VGLRPLHDWSSHAADAFGLMAVNYEDPSRLARFNRKLAPEPGFNPGKRVGSGNLSLCEKSARRSERFLGSSDPHAEEERPSSA
jgi:hypothetical protein